MLYLFSAGIPLLWSTVAVRAWDSGIYSSENGQDLVQTKDWGALHPTVPMYYALLRIFIWAKDVHWQGHAILRKAIAILFQSSSLNLSLAHRPLGDTSAIHLDEAPIISQGVATRGSFANIWRKVSQIVLHCKCKVKAIKVDGSEPSLFVHT